MNSQQQIILSFPERKSLNAEDFLVLPTNNQAYVATNSFPQNEGDVLVVYGSKGVGKSHLLSIYKKRTGSVGLELDLSQKHWAVDDIDTLNAEQQEQLFHIFNHVKSSGGSLLVTSTLPTAKLDILLDLKSRLLTAPQIEIEAPKDAHLEVFLVKYASDRQIFLEPKVVNYILKNCERNVSHVEFVVSALDKLSLEQKRKITVPLVKEVLQNLNK